LKPRKRPPSPLMCALEHPTSHGRNISALVVATPSIALRWRAAAADLQPCSTFTRWPTGVKFFIFAWGHVQLYI
jgi:hypothetical protein